MTAMITFEKSSKELIDEYLTRERTSRSFNSNSATWLAASRSPSASASDTGENGAPVGGDDDAREAIGQFRKHRSNMTHVNFDCLKRPWRISHVLHQTQILLLLLTSYLTSHLSQKTDWLIDLALIKLLDTPVMETPSSISTDTMNRLSTRLAYFGKDFPSDNLTDLFRRLHRWSKDKRHAYLALFLEESVAVVRDEVEKLPKPVPEQVTNLQNIGSLVDGFEAIRTTPIGGALEGTLLVVLQIAALIGLVHSSRVLRCIVNIWTDTTKQTTRYTTSLIPRPP